ncbi:MAG: AAA family ATPase [Francisellaceae bacterium]|jgi:flagellar biosynthesis protein FlhG|nr:AAA family ATPase [Francisellaceae bacterium]
MQFKYVVGITGGKGGVGKSNIAVNLGSSLAKLGYKPLIIDADINLGNIELLLGVESKNNIMDLLSGRCDIDDVLIQASPRLDILPTGIARNTTVELKSTDVLSIISHIERSSNNHDVIIVDTSSGVGATVMNMLRLCQDILVVVCNEPTSIMDAYSLIKTMNIKLKRNTFSFLASMVNSEQEAKNTYQSLVRVTDNFLDVNLKYFGHVLRDNFVAKAIKQQEPYVLKYPEAKASKCILNITKKIMYRASTSKGEGTLLRETNSN